MPNSRGAQSLAPFDAYIAANLAVATQQATVFQGPILWTAETNVPPVPAALGTYVPAWFPVLRQAPRGRIGGLWSVTADGAVVYHDGTAWNAAPAIAGVSVLGVDVGEDGVPFALATGAGGAALYQFDTAALAWGPPLALGSITPQQLSVGDASRVYVLGTRRHSLSPRQWRLCPPHHPAPGHRALQRQP